ncbi:MAG TPA: tRNA uridine-5-carboxymethylaminomethyl(34) synthesis GTPase MnmE [Chitinophagales bacterium]|nr:tRNA uridine-5-carboxymethylaminomethyl(34) synthesis GTPase MnmE [Chitinophagales bacterium]HQO30907.1 tRNA uridine-5-carboxymethylaminomethyl(34) synthesis GTPase MnmE [Chitinophagales bacterium]HQO88480.1 tRNA uridine-5-carboxymethylaminomethyl(34) synthesis GTPase MnmE [Chitinophagales bacterium]
MNTHYHSDTIVALSTPQGVGAIGVIRLSGADAVAIVQRVFKGKDLRQQQSHTLHFGYLMQDDKVLDEVVVSLFLAPSSYTKENVVEISCHGSPYIQQKIIELLIDQGARPAKPGEFTLRAFLNGRFDLSQAEAVADLIASDSQAAHQIAMQQMRGGISQKLKELRTALIEFAALIELELDFGEEDVEFADRSKLHTLLHQIVSELNTLIQSFQYGNAIKNGIQVAIVGKPNAGKSTLLNALLREERAIVSDIAGTTRDTIEETLTIDGLLFRFIDTAGLRETGDVIEKIGVEKSREKIRQADIVIFLYDHCEETAEQLQSELSIIPPDKKCIIAANKTDICPERTVPATLNGIAVVALSAKKHDGLETLKKELTGMVLDGNVSANNTIITNQRHYESLQQSLKAVQEVITKLHDQIPADLVAQDIRVALRHLGNITGEIDTDKDILATIFSKFCIGK